MRISDWSSDVCSSDLVEQRRPDIDEADIGLHHRRCETEREERQRGDRAQQDDLDEVHPRPREPVHRFRAVVDRVKTPEEGEFVEAAVEPILHEIRRDEDDGELGEPRSEEHTSELQSLMRISYAVFCLKKNNKQI